MFDHTEYDFESLARGANAEHRFRIKNVFHETIRIASVRSSCGCTKTRLTKTVLESGDEADLIAEFNTVAFEGDHSATLTVIFAAPYAAEVRLRVHGFVRKDVVFQPGRIEFGSVDTEAGAETRVQIAYAGRPDWEIVDVRSRNRDFEVELKPTARSGGRIKYDMLFRLKPGAPSGYINDQLVLVTNDRANRTIPLAVEGRVISSLTVSPTSLHMGVVEPGQSVTRRLVVRGTKPFRIVGISCESGDECLTFEPPDAARTVHLIPVKFTAPDKTGKIVEKIRILTEGTSSSLPVVVAQAEVREP